MRIGLVVEYDGTEFHGSQLQKSVRTVQGELTKAVRTVFEDEIGIRLASRTDAGVHARGQVAAFDADTELSEDTIRKALNYYLPEDVRTKAVARTADRFDPRRHAESREYVYTLTDAEVPSPIRKRFEAPVKGRLDEDAMERAGAVFCGVHDFAAFAGPASPRDACTVRRVDSVSTKREGDRVEITIRGNAFVHQQVRRMTAALVDIGQVRTSVDQIKAYLHGANRGTARRLMPARGLCLASIIYAGAGPNGLPRTNGN